MPALIPALNPPPLLREMIDDLRRCDFGPLIVVDDGSAASYRPIFDRIAALPEAVLLRHAVNRGKGAALRTGLAYVLRAAPAAIGAITIDADGQHRLDDAVRVAEAFRRHPEALVIGSRRLTPAAPFRSRLGNAVARRFVRGAAGLALADTQCGLRAIPLAVIPALLGLPSRRYDFELEMLLTCRRAGLPLREVPIEARYLVGNAGSHFRPLRDSARIAWALARHTLDAKLNR